MIDGIGEDKIHDGIKATTRRDKPYRPRPGTQSPQPKGRSDIEWPQHEGILYCPRRGARIRFQRGGIDIMTVPIPDLPQDIGVRRGSYQAYKVEEIIELRQKGDDA